MTCFLAIVSTPGYLPDTEPVSFDSRSAAWSYLADERRRHEDDMYADGDSDVYSDCWWTLSRFARTTLHVPDASLDTDCVVGETPGRDTDPATDLGLEYSVAVSEECAEECACDDCVVYA